MAKVKTAAVDAETKAAANAYFDENPPVTIDNPPKEPKEPKAEASGQTMVAGVEPKKDKNATTNTRYDYGLSLKLKGIGNLTVAEAKDCPADMVEEMLRKGFNRGQFWETIRLLIGKPLNASVCDKQLSSEREQAYHDAYEKLRIAIDIALPACSKPKLDAPASNVNKLERLGADLKGALTKAAELIKGAA